MAVAEKAEKYHIKPSLCFIGMALCTSITDKMDNYSDRKAITDRYMTIPVNYVAENRNNNKQKELKRKVR